MISIYNLFFFCIFWGAITGCSSGNSNDSQKNIGLSNKQSPPTNLIVISLGYNRISLAWEDPIDSDDQIIRYDVYMRESNSSLFSFNRSATQNSCEIDELNPSSTYFFKICAIYNDNIESTFSNIIEVTTLATPNEKYGAFIDCPVSNLRYFCGKLRGLTTDNGNFKYYEGEMVSFYISDLLIGQCQGKDVVTPIDLVNGAVDEKDPTVTNICRFLQSLDSDTILDNGIRINSGAEDAITDLNIDFNQSTEDFGNNRVILGLFDTLNTKNYFSNMNGYLRSPQEAQDHFRVSLDILSENISYDLATDLESGFPIGVQQLMGKYHAGPVISNLVGDIDGDLYKEIIFSGLASGPLYAYKYDGSFLFIFGKPIADSVVYPALGKLKKDSSGLEVVFGGLLKGTISAYDGFGNLLVGWPIPDHNYISNPPTLSDIDSDGIDEIFIGEANSCINGYKADGSILPGWPVKVSGNYMVSHIAAGDIDHDDKIEIIAVNYDQAIYAMHGDGSTVNGFPMQIIGNVDVYPVIGDVDDDGSCEIVVGCFNSSIQNRFVETILIASNDGKEKYTIDLPYYRSFYGSAPVLADIDDDDVPEIIYRTNSYLYIFEYDGNKFICCPGWPQRLSKGASCHVANSSPVVGDVDGDGKQEIVVTVFNSFNEDEIQVYEIDGHFNAKFPKRGSLNMGGTAAIDDIDQDGRNEIVVRGNTSEYDPIIYVYDLGGQKHGAIEWGQFGRDFRHTNFYPKKKNKNKVIQQ